MMPTNATGADRSPWRVIARWLPSISMRQMFALVGYFAGVFGLLRSYTPLACSIAESLLFVLFVAAILLAMYGRTSSRAFWMGTLVAGLLFFLLAKGALPLYAYRFDLVTRRLNGPMFLLMHPKRVTRVYPPSTYSSPANSLAQYSLLLSNFRDEDSIEDDVAIDAPSYIVPRQFTQCCDCLWTILLGTIGGYVAMNLQRRNQGQQQLFSESPSCHPPSLIPRAS